jgi:hypothetical protein
MWAVADCRTLDAGVEVVELFELLHPEVQTATTATPARPETTRFTADLFHVDPGPGTRSCGAFEGECTDHVTDPLPRRAR